MKIFYLLLLSLILFSCSSQAPTIVHKYIIKIEDESQNSISNVDLKYKMGTQDTTIHKTINTASSNILVDSIKVIGLEKDDGYEFSSYLSYTVSKNGFLDSNGTLSINEIEETPKQKLKNILVQLKPIIQTITFKLNSNSYKNPTINATYYDGSNIIKSEQVNYSDIINIKPYKDGIKVYSKIEFLAYCKGYTNSMYEVKFSGQVSDTIINLDFKPAWQVFEIKFVDKNKKQINDLIVEYEISNGFHQKVKKSAVTGEDGILIDSIQANSDSKLGFGYLSKESILTYKAEKEFYKSIEGKVENWFGSIDKNQSSNKVLNTVTLKMLSKREIAKIKKEKYRLEIIERSYNGIVMDKYGDEWYNGHEVYTGPRGGKYYYNSRGNKQYVPR
jgi:hypothetical protein